MSQNDINNTSAGTAAQNKQYQYGEEKRLQQGGPGTPSKREFHFSFSGQDDVLREMKKPRSKAYLSAIQAVDMLSKTDEEIIAKLKEQMDEDDLEELSELSVEELMEEIRLSLREELQEFEDKHRAPVAILSRCYITGCDCHGIDSQGNFMEHYAIGSPMPAGLDKGRKLIHKYPDCHSVEVYHSFCLVVQPDGSVVEVTDQ